MKDDIIVVVIVVAVIVAFLMLTQKPAQQATSVTQTTHSITGLDGLFSSTNPGVLTALAAL